MSYNLNIVTECSNKSVKIMDLNSNIVTNNVSNEMIQLPYNNSYIIYISSDVQVLTVSSFGELLLSLFGGFVGYTFIIVIVILFITFLSVVKRHVK